MVLKMGIEFSMSLDPMTSTGFFDVSSFDETYIVREYHQDDEGNDLRDDTHIKSEKVVTIPQQKITGSIKKSG